jgi:hypothetical protein
MMVKNRVAESPQRPPKIEVMRALLEHAEAQVHFDARKPGVELPDRLLGSPNVRLDYGYSLVPPIPDLTVDENGIRATLSFNRVPFETFVPWDAVFLIADFSGRGAVWREALPPELAADLVVQEVEGPDGTRPITEPEMKPARRFTVLDGNDNTDGRPMPQAKDRNDMNAVPPPDDDSSPEPDPEPPRPRPTLRLVK